MFKSPCRNSCGPWLAFYTCCPWEHSHLFFIQINESHLGDDKWLYEVQQLTARPPASFESVLLMWMVERLKRRNLQVRNLRFPAWLSAAAHLFTTSQNQPLLWQPDSHFPMCSLGAEPMIFKGALSLSRLWRAPGKASDGSSALCLSCCKIWYYQPHQGPIANNVWKMFWNPSIGKGNVSSNYCSIFFFLKYCLDYIEPLSLKIQDTKTVIPTWQQKWKWWFHGLLKSASVKHLSVLGDPAEWGVSQFCRLTPSLKCVKELNL